MIYEPEFWCEVGMFFGFIWTKSVNIVVGAS